MKIRTILATTILSASAFAADSTQKVDVNFAFRTPSGEHAAGAYTMQVRQTPTMALMELRSAETGKTVLFYPVSSLLAKRGEQPRLVFKCGGSGCDLAEVWSDAEGFAIRQRKPVAGEDRVAVAVPMKKSNATD